MRNLMVYFIIAILIYSQNPSIIKAEMIKSVDSEKDVILLAKEIEKDIIAYSSIELIESGHNDYILPNETEVVWLTSEKNVEYNGIQYSLILYTEDEQDVLKLYVDTKSIVPIEEVDTYKLNRLNKAENIDSTEENEDNSTDGTEDLSAESDFIENQDDTDDTIESNYSNIQEQDEQAEEMDFTIQTYRSMSATRSLVVVLENGMRHADVKTLKANLKRLGFTVPGNGTNLYGKNTEQKVREFQRYYGLSADGKAGPATFNKINSILNSPLQKGKRHNDTKKLKADLKSIGYPVPGKGTTLYGTDTERIVKKFQKDQGLIVNGIADEKTLAKIAALKATTNKPSNTTPSVLENGMRHADVKTLKANLKRLGFTVPGNGTNLYGKNTEQKVREFQRYYGLSADGKAGPATFNKINSILNSPLQKGKRHNDTKKLKADLKSIGYPVPGNGTTLYGIETEKIIKQFQKDHKLVVNGIADDVTLNKIASLTNNSKAIKIFIDPGHGGSDPGAVSNGVQEKVITLDIAKRVEKYLNQYRGVEIRLSRINDTTLSLAQRTDAANKWNADFFFSIHINSGGGNGVESFIYNNKPTQDEINKQKIIHDHITSQINDRDRGKKRANFHVLRESNMTAMLFEYLFVDTYGDRIKLTNASYRDKLAKATAEGIAKAYGLRK